MIRQLTGNNKFKRNWRCTVLISMIPFTIIYFWMVKDKAWCMGLLPYWHIDGYSGRVVDGNSKKPLQNVAILAVYKKCSPSISGEMCQTVLVREAKTNKYGEFELKNIKKWFSDNRGHPKGTIIVFKPGYATLWRSASKAGNGIGLRPQPNKHMTYELFKLNTVEERIKNLPSLSLIFYRLDVRPEDVCPYFLRLLNEEEAFLGQAQSPQQIVQPKKIDQYIINRDDPGPVSK